MKQINLLPKPTFIEHYQKPLSIVFALALLLSLLLYEGSRFLDMPPFAKLSSLLFSTSQITSNFAKHSIYQLQMVGYLCKTNEKNTNVCWCVIKAPEDEVLTLKIGDYVGYEKAEVVAIKPTGIYLNVAQKKDPLFICAKTSTPQ